MDVYVKGCLSRSWLGAECVTCMLVIGLRRYKTPLLYFGRSPHLNGGFKDSNPCYTTRRLWCVVREGNVAFPKMLYQLESSRRSNFGGFDFLVTSWAREVEEFERMPIAVATIIFFSAVRIQDTRLRKRYSSFTSSQSGTVCLSTSKYLVLSRLFLFSFLGCILKVIRERHLLVLDHSWETCVRTKTISLRPHLTQITSMSHFIYGARQAVKLFFYWMSIREYTVTAVRLLLRLLRLLV